MAGGELSSSEHLKEDLRDLRAELGAWIDYTVGKYGAWKANREEARAEKEENRLEIFRAGHDYAHNTKLWKKKVEKNRRLIRQGKTKEFLMSPKQESYEFLWRYSAPIVMLAGIGISEVVHEADHGLFQWLFGHGLGDTIHHYVEYPVKYNYTLIPLTIVGLTWAHYKFTGGENRDADDRWAAHAATWYERKQYQKLYDRAVSSAALKVKGHKYKAPVEQIVSSEPVMSSG